MCPDLFAECASLTLATDIDGSVIAVIAITGGLSVAMLGIVLGTVRQMVQTRQREQTRREIAAYIAEGSMTPDEGERLLKADGRRGGAGC